VYAAMNREGVANGERFRAVLALVWSLVGVRPSVGGEVSRR